MKNLINFLNSADVPELRKDITKPENIRWLLRNLGIRNSRLPGFQEAYSSLKKLEKGPSQMTTFDITAKVLIETHICTNPNCGSEFSVLLINRPSQEYLNEEPAATGSYTTWATKSQYRPFCPSCGQQIK